MTDRTNRLPEAGKGRLPPRRRALLRLFCTVGGLGRLVPRGGGTLGALAALPLGWLLAPLDLVLRLGVVALLVLLSLVVAQVYVADCQSEDPQEVVLDELVGCLVALQFGDWRLVPVVIAFVLFRLFDIAKPWPVGLLDRRVKGGLGVMLDDLVAGLMAGLVVLAHRLLF